MEAIDDEMEHIERSLVCELPDGVELTEDLWKRILAHWLACGRKLLNAEKVLAIASNPEQKQLSTCKMQGYPPGYQQAQCRHYHVTREGWLLVSFELPGGPPLRLALPTNRATESWINGLQREFTNHARSHSANSLGMPSEPTS